MTMILMHVSSQTVPESGIEDGGMKKNSGSFPRNACVACET